MLTLRGNRQLIFRSYMIIVVGVLVLGFLLDWVLLNKLNDGADETRPADQALVQASYALIEQQLATRQRHEWAPALQRLQDRLPPTLDMQLTSIDDIAAVSGDIARQLQSRQVAQFYDADQQVYFYKVLTDGNTVLSLQPQTAATAADRQWQETLRPLIPLVFYASIFVLVWIWIRPLLRDLDSLIATAQALQRDHRESVPDFHQVSTIRPLADSFRSMTVRLRGLIEGQKEFTNALSHELRTPLARIKFGLAMLEKDLHSDAQPELDNLRKDVQEIDALIHYAHGRGMDLTLIEEMPAGDTGADRASRALSLTDLQRDLARRWTLSPLRANTGGPARYMRIAETGGRIGFISPMSCNFCALCNRVRVSCTGQLFPCMGDDGAVDLRAPLRTSDAAAMAAIRTALEHKPERHRFDPTRMNDPAVARHMSALGG